MIAMGRSDLVVSQALSSRYFTTAAIVYIGLFMLILELPILSLAEVAGSTVAAFAIVASLSAMHSESSHRSLPETDFRYLANRPSQLQGWTSD